MGGCVVHDDRVIGRGAAGRVVAFWVFLFAVLFLQLSAVISQENVNPSELISGVR